MSAIKVTKEEIKKISELANIYIPEDELGKYADWVTEILEYVQMIQEVDTGKLEFKTQVELENVLSEDIPEESLTQQEAVSNRSDQSQNGYFTIGSVFKEN